MKIIGVIAEYNPFHLGHVYQIKKIRELYPNSLIIAIISTNFTERGEISVLNKWDKTQICLNNDIDLVIELPTLYATQSADMFAYGALKILNDLHIDTLVFGSETDDISELVKLAKIQLTDKKYDSLVKKYLEQGVNYPTAMSKALFDINKTTVNTPNDLLGLSYVKEIVKNNYPITPVAIKRTNDYHGKKVLSNVVNASLIRKLYFNNENVSKYLPDDTLHYLNQNATFDNAYKFLVYSIINNRNNLDQYLTIDEGIENRILKYINEVDNWHDLVMKIKTKRYTYNKINRMLIHILLGIKKDDNTMDTYIRVLGFNKHGMKYLNKVKKTLSLPIYSGYKESISRVFDIEYNSTYIYSLITNNLSLIQREYKSKPIIKD